MKSILGAALAFAAFPTALAMAQSSQQDSSLPESMRIQQSVTQQNANGSQSPTSTNTSTTGSSTSSEAPGGAGTGVERNRIDPSAPSPQRLQIDDGASASVRRNPDVDTVHPGSTGTSYNSVLRGAPSSSGVNSGASGASGGVAGSSAIGGGGVGGGAAGGK